MDPNKFPVIISDLIMPHISVVIVISCVAGYMSTSNFMISDMFYLSLLAFLINTSGNVINNYYDWELDKVNSKRDYLKEVFSKDNLVMVYILLLVLVGVMVSIHIKSEFIIWIIIALLVTNLYSSLKIERIFPLNYLWIAFGYGVIAFVTGVTYIENLNHNYLQYSLVPFFIILTLIPSKDFSDYWGDKKFNKRTLVTLIGIKRASLILCILLCLEGLIFITYAQYILGIILLMASIVLYGLIQRKKFKLVELSGYVFMVLALIAYLVSFIHHM